MQQIVSHNEEETKKIGNRIGDILKKGDIVCLKGDLGAGKTTLSKSIADALGVDEPVTSPTYTLIHEYQGRIPLYHFDVYRISEPDEMFDLGFDEYLFGEGVCIIEWADKIETLLPETCIWITIKNGENFNERIMEIQGLNVEL